MNNFDSAPMGMGGMINEHRGELTGQIMRMPKPTPMNLGAT